jgi:predicted transcriptional regulator
MTALVTKEKGSPVIRIESDKNKEYGDFKTIELKLQPHLGSCIVSTPSARVSQNENGISSLPSQELKALLILASHRKMGSTDWKRVCEAEGIPEPTFYDVIKKLTAAGFVVRFDEPRNRVFYEITEAGRLSAEAYSNGPIP